MNIIKNQQLKTRFKRIFQSQRYYKSFRFSVIQTNFTLRKHQMKYRLML